ncbi:MAG TPA: rRNA maturation RNase YbeY [Gemmatimonadales bacterium]
MVVSGRRLPLPAARVRRVVEAVLRGERREASISVTFLGPEAMRRLNARHKGKDRPTDVLAFALEGPGDRAVGDVYLCASVARQEARARDLPLREELTRLIVHGTLHALGWEHTEGDARTRSAMWRRQERYVEALA